MDTNKSKKLYKKYNSFFGIRVKNKYNLNDFLKNLKFILKEKSNLKNISKYENRILEDVKKDLFETGLKKKTKFFLERRRGSMRGTLATRV